MRNLAPTRIAADRRAVNNRLVLPFSFLVVAFRVSLSQMLARATGVLEEALLAWRAVLGDQYVITDDARHRQRSYYQPDWERAGARARRRPTFRSFWPNVRLGSCAADWSDRAHGLRALCPRACREGLRVGGWPRFQRHVFAVFVWRRYQDDVLAESGPSKFSVLQHRNQRFKGLAAAH